MTNLQCNDEVVPGRCKWRRRCFVVIGIWALTTFLLTFSQIRGLVVYPLFVHDPDAAGEAAYVMADGPASYERLVAASDLYHMDRVPRIILLNETQSSGYNFVEHRSESRVERCANFLMLRGVPRDQISWIDADDSTTMGSLREARGFAKQASELQRIVVVTSAPHTRRSRLAFRRSLRPEVQVDVYSASEPFHSAEVHSPIWVEYVKLLVYYFVA